VVQCNNREKVLLASHQLSGPAADWWDAYVKAHEEPESINWLAGVQSRFPCTSCSPGSYQSKEEGVSGSETGVMSVNEYVTKFTQLSRYALHEVDTDEKKHECLLNDLNDGLAYALEARDFENF
jgi:hypothetical protein